MQVGSVLVPFLLAVGYVEPANILFFFGAGTYSHRILVWPLVETLAERGHNLTFFSAFTPKSPNPKVIEVHPEPLRHFAKGMFGPDSNLFNRRVENTHQSVWFEQIRFAEVVCESIFLYPEGLAWLNNAKYDLIVIDTWFNDCAHAIAWKLGIPKILFGTSTIYMWEFDEYGMPAETSWIPDPSKDIPQQMNFMERVYNTLHPLHWYFKRHLLIFPKLEKIIRTHDAFKDDMPSLRQLERNVSLVLQNSHYSIDYARSLPPLHVLIGGIHCERMKLDPLPVDIEKFIEDSPEGFIYISFGSAVQISKMMPYYRSILFNAIGNSSMRFVWKYEEDRPADMPVNVITAKWTPQHTILSNPKIKAFITHGGLLSTEEAIYNSVPLIVLPVFDEQDYNAQRSQMCGYGIRLEFTTLTESQLRSAIEEITHNPKYLEGVKQHSIRFRDRPMSPLNTAVWWTEYVLRTRDTSFLLPLGTHQTWYERRLLDVWAFIIISIVTVFALILIFCTKALTFLCSLNSNFVSQSGKPTKNKTQ